MILYPEVSFARSLAAWLVGAVVALPVGFGFWSLLRTLRERSRISRLFADFWVGSVATFAGISIAVAIAGPYLFAHQYKRRADWYTDPYTPGLGLFMSLIFGVVVAWGGWSRRLPLRPRLRQRLRAAVREARRTRRDA